jgi:transcriptional regulator with XRE-family HTH domain
MPGICAAQEQPMIRTLGVILRAEREKRNLSQRRLAQLAGLPPTTVRDIENGKVNSPRPATLMALAQALDLPIEHLLSTALPEGNGVGEVISLPASEVGRLLAEYSQLPPERRALVLNLIRALRNTQAP